MSYFMERKLKKILIDPWWRLNTVKKFFAMVGLAIEVDMII